MFALLHRLNRVTVFFCAVLGFLAPAPALAQVNANNCKGPGYGCSVYNVKTYSKLAVADLPSCNAGSIGKMQWATNGGADGGGSTMQCDGVSWISMGGGGSSSDSCTGGYCTIGDGGLYWDGGTEGAIFAQRFVASIAGPGTTAFECRNQTASSSPCINNPSNIMELFTTPPNKDQSNINFPDFLFLSQAPDGGTRTAGYLLGVLSGPSSAELPQAAFTWNGGLELNASLQGGGLTMNGAVADIRNPTAGGYLRFTSGGDTAAGPMVLYYNGLGTAITSGNFVEYYDSSAALISAVSYQGAQRLGKVATASLETSAASTEGSIVWDTTADCVKQNNGSAWSACLSTAAGAINNYWSTTCFGTCSSEDTNFTGGIYSLGGAVTRMTCSWGTAGTGGSTGVVVKVRNVTGGSDLCTCTVGACTIAANTPTACTCAGTFTAGSLYTMQLDATTDCAGNPANIVCTASVVP